MANYNSNVSTPNETQSRIIRWDKEYLFSVPGILKGVQLICNIVGFICIKVSSAWVSPIFYNILYWVGLIVTLFITLMYTMHVVEKFSTWPWLKFEFFFYCGICLTYICCSIFAATITESVGYAVGFFGLCAVIAYGFDAFLKFKALRQGLPAQSS